MLRIGHRGARAYEPENTLLSFKKALEIGVDAVEFDVRRVRSGELVVIHDDKVDRTTNGSGAVNALTLSEIRQFTTEKGEKIPTLEEALDYLDNKAKILIELKESGLEEDLLALIRKKNLTKNVIIVSFLEEALRKTKSIIDDIETGLIYVKHKNPIEAALDLRVSYILPLYRFTHSKLIQKVHENGLKVIVWTINSHEEAYEYAKKGVDGIASDKPSILMDL
jgi:glycerophosphoryl diester phosphodiesterase